MSKITEMTPFQLVLLGVFAGLGLLGVIVLALYQAGSDRPSEVTLTVWGVMDSREFRSWENNARVKRETNITLNYEQKRPETFEKELVRALATEVGPDLFFLPDRKINQYRELIQPIPYSLMTRSDFQNTFAEHARVYELEEGLAGMPLQIDPLVTYWNRDLVSAAGRAAPPATWPELDSFAAAVAGTDGVNVSRAAFPLGGYQNIRHSREI